MGARVKEHRVEGERIHERIFSDQRDLTLGSATDTAAPRRAHRERYGARVGQIEGLARTGDADLLRRAGRILQRAEHDPTR